MSTPIDRNVLESVFDAGQRAAPVHTRPDGGYTLVIPHLSKEVTIPPLEPILTRIKQSVLVYSEAAFVDYVQSFKSERSRIFAVPGFLADGRGPVVKCIVDYHMLDVPNYKAHIVEYVPRYSEAWERWSSPRTFGQVEFAEHIEENRSDIIEPAAADLLDIIRTFKASRKVSYDSVVYQNDGSVSVAYSDKVEQASGSKSVTVPAELKLGIRVYHLGSVYSVPVLMRYRMGEGKVLFSTKMDRGDLIEQAAFDEILARVATATSVPVHLGIAR